MMITLPFAFLGVFRYHHLVLIGHINGRPENLLTDRPTVINGALWMILALSALYDLPSNLVSLLG
jgi:hypothetical protein